MPSAGSLHCNVMLFITNSPGAVSRGLVVDKQRGYVLKIDRNKYVRKAMLGFENLDSTIRKTTYNKDVVSFSEESFVNIDSTSLVIGEHP